jgi:hypothetical protein
MNFSQSQAKVGIIMGKHHMSSSIINIENDTNTIDAKDALRAFI